MTVKEIYRTFQQEKFDVKNADAVFVSNDGVEHAIKSVELIDGVAKFYEQGAEPEPADDGG